MNLQTYRYGQTIAAAFAAAILSTVAPAAGPEVKQAVTINQIEHVQITTPKKFEDVQAAFESSVPKIAPDMVPALIAGDEKRVAEAEKGGPLFIFLTRAQGKVLQIAGQARKGVSYDIGNAHTATKMTRHRIAAGLYVPLRLMLYEDNNGQTVFEYDKPSSVLGQFKDERVTEVARGLDSALESAIRKVID